MHKKFIAVSSLALGAGLFLTGQMVSQATAQEKSVTSLQPQGNWKVSRFDGVDPAKDSYCALTRQYNQGIILTLGRNVLEEHSLAIDFQDNRLNTDKAYSMTLQPGPGQIRAYELMPASAQAMVVRLGYDDSFFNGLKQSKMLKVDLNGVNYHFSLPDIQSGQGDLKKCMAGLPGKSTTKVASGFSAEKMDSAPPVKAVKIVQEKAAAKKVITQKVEKAQASIPKAEKIKTAVKAVEIKKAVPVTAKIPKDVAKIETTKIETVKIKPVKVAIKKEIKKIESKAKVVVPDAVVAPPPVLLSAKDAVPAARVEKAPLAVPLKKSKAIEMVKVESKKIAPPPSLKPESSRKVSVEVAKKKTFIKKELSQIAAVKVAPIEAKKVVQPIQQPVHQQPAAVVKPAPSGRVSSPVSSLADISARSYSGGRPARLALTEQVEQQKRQRAKMKQLEADNERLNKALHAGGVKKIAPALVPKIVSNNSAEEKKRAEARMLEKARIAEELKAAKAFEKEAALAKLKAEKERQQKVAEQKVVAQEAKAAKQRQEQQAELERQLQVQRQADAAKQLQKQQAEAAKKTAKKVVEASPEVIPAEEKAQLNDLKAENQRLSVALQGQKDKMKAPVSSSPKEEKELANMRTRIQELEKENKKFYLQARESQGRLDSAIVESGTETLKKIRSYERRLEAAQADNLTLSRQMEKQSRVQEDGRLSGVAKGDWSLEKATKRYNEAEREIKRLGLLMEQQRVSHRQEKTELEGMLFDPAVTDQEQRRRLTELELQLEKAEEQLQRGSRGSSPVMQRAGRGTSAAPHYAGTLSSARERVSVGAVSVTPVPAPRVDSAVTQQQENLEITRLNSQVARQNKQLRIYNQNANANVRGGAEPSGAPLGQDGLQQLLQRAGVSVRGQITSQSGGRYRWNAGSLVGSAEIVPIKSAGSLNQFVQRYIAKEKSSCSGDFAAVPTASNARSQSIDVACISASRSMLSSVVFTQKGNDLIAISHQAGENDMSMAMDARDRIASGL